MPGYRISGETDNAWIHLGWFARSRIAAGVTEGTGLTKKSNRTGAPIRQQAHSIMLVPGAAAGNAAADIRESDLLCSMRQLMLLLHNPRPRARVFGFKEIYSPFVRNVSLLGEVFSQGVDFVRAMFPRAKFIFHYRRNLTRASDSDFWHREELVADHRQRLRHFQHVVDSYLGYVRANPDHSFASTLEGITDKYNTSHLLDLFRFLDEPLTGPTRRTATSQTLKLNDWSEERHKRRIKRIDGNGSVSIETREYAFTKQMSEAHVPK